MFVLAVLLSIAGAGARLGAGTEARKTELRLPGLEQPVAVLRDRWGVPHIFARNQHDLFFAQGYVAAGDRLFQMELWKRTGQGRLAEILGPSAVQRDINARLLRYRGNLDAEYSSYAPDALAILEAFTAGINAYIDGRRGNLPIEFRVAGFAPEHWRPEDCLSRNAAFSMTSNAEAELYVAQLVSALDAEKARALLQLDPPVKLDPFDVADYAGLSPEILANIVSSDKRIEFPAPHESNNWTVSGALTATGRPMLANDPHRVIALPSLRYIVHLVAPGWDVEGSGEPALPGVAIGHNQQVAWGFTIFAADQQDLYIEKLNPENPLLYKTELGWEKMRIEPETLHVNGAPDVHADLKFTRHGPVIWEDVPSHRALALRWVGAEPGSAGYLASLSLDRAQNWEQFRDALRRWKLPPENFAYADAHGSIGEQSAGLVPHRVPRWTGLLPVPGDSGHEWSARGSKETPWRSLDELPHVSNPPEGFAATANHRTIAENDPDPVGYEWSHFRYERIHEYLEAARTAKRKLTLRDMGSLQNDVVSLPAQRFQALLREPPPKIVIKKRDDPDPDEAQPALVMILKWDARLDADSPAAALYEAWLSRLKDAAIAAQPERIRATVAEYFSDEDTLQFYSDDARRSRLLPELAEAWDKLIRRQGKDPAKWAWGKLHLVRFRHPLDEFPAARDWDLGPFSRPGDANTVDATAGANFAQTEGASYREIFDVGGWDNSLAINTPGQSGDPKSQHYKDLLPLWLKGEYFPLLYSRAAIEKNLEEELDLLPANAP